MTDSKEEQARIVSEFREASASFDEVTVALFAAYEHSPNLVERLPVFMFHTGTTPGGEKTTGLSVTKEFMSFLKGNAPLSDDDMARLVAENERRRALKSA